MKHDWARGGGMNVPRMRRPEDPSAGAGLIMEVISLMNYVCLMDVTVNNFFLVALQYLIISGP